MSKTKDLSAFEWGMVVGARRTGLSVSRNPTLLSFSRSTFSHVYQEWSTTQRTSSRLGTIVGSLESTWASIPVERFRHHVESMPRRSEGVQLNIRKVFLMFDISHAHSIWLGIIEGHHHSYIQTNMQTTWKDILVCLWQYNVCNCLTEK